MRRILTQIGWGALGMLLVLLLWHLWLDHALLHELAEYIRLQAPKINSLPVPTP